MTPLGLRCSLAAATLVGLAATSARAEPAVLYVPTEDVVLTPTSTPGCTSQVNSATGCTAGLDMMQVVPPYAGAMALRDALELALAPYDVHIATERPPQYLAYTMLLASETPDPASTSVTCSRGGINCGARKRNGIVQIFGPTPNCSVLDVPLASTYAFGRISGLEGVADPLDAMRYIPNFATQSGTFVDGCSPRVQQISFDEMGVGTELPFECTSLDHNGCGSDEQNGHADLLAYYGPRTIDEDPPLLTNLQPGDGAVIEFGDDLVMDVDIADADPVLGGRWTVYSPVLEDFDFPDGILTFCTNDVCDAGWDDGTPLKATNSDWSLVLSGIPEGTYELTFEVSDFHGNVATSPTIVVYVGDPPPGSDTGEDTGEWDTGSVDSSGGPGMTTGASGPPPPLDSGADVGPGPSDDSGTGEPEADDGGLVPHGCLCTSRGGRRGAGGWWLVVVGALVRRRARARARKCSE
ncbi:hypothetical protein [Paraliomyxa miuraensis]|uniref:hypothetical protein n=1 Tax=Paraliomyxa miuraensis TaxID=376150 RepID=UPI002257DD23|nr:hypothetical protein [Paraliomyxa miuraensis]MCX4240697.1 hypothetical protein [Paraliomyxa miuraensis]